MTNMLDFSSAAFSCSLSSTPPPLTLIFILLCHQAHFPIQMELNPWWQSVLTTDLRTVLPHGPADSVPSHDFTRASGSVDLAILLCIVKARGD